MISGMAATPALKRSSHSVVCSPASTLTSTESPTPTCSGSTTATRCVMTPRASSFWMRFQQGVAERPTRSAICAIERVASCCRMSSSCRSISSTACLLGTAGLPARRRRSARYGRDLYPLQGAVDVGEQVGLGLEPGRQAHEPVADAERLALLGLQPRMRRRRRMRDEALRIAEIVLDIDQPQRVEKTEAGLLVAGDIAGHDRAARLHLLARQLVLRVARQAGIDHPADLRVGFEMA